MTLSSGTGSHQTNRWGINHLNPKTFKLSCNLYYLLFWFLKQLKMRLERDSNSVKGSPKTPFLVKIIFVIQKSEYMSLKRNPNGKKVLVMEVYNNQMFLS